MSTHNNPIPTAAATERDNLLGLLRVAKCPNCDGSGIVMRGGGILYVSREMAIDAGDPSMEGSVYHEEQPHPEQCQWCDERNALFAGNNPSP